jgi:hypothetical protein
VTTFIDHIKKNPFSAAADCILSFVIVAYSIVNSGKKDLRGQGFQDSSEKE